MSDENNIENEELNLSPDSFVDENLGDPDAYYKELLSKPLPENLVKYFFDKYKFKSKEQFIEFLQGPTFVEEVAEFDYLLFFEQMLGNIVKDFHKLFVKQVYSHRAITLAPRDVGKSHFFSVGLPVWIAYYNKANKIMVISETDDQAKRVLEEIKGAVEKKAVVKDKLWVKTTAKESVWNKNKIKTKTGVEIMAKSLMSKTRGFHPQTLILDDVLSNENSLTKQQREKVFTHFAQSIQPMASKKAMIQFVGTAQHKDDLLHKLGMSPANTFKFLKLKAYDEDTESSIWPEKLTEEHLENYRKTYGIVSFEKEYQNNPMADNLSLFPMHVLEKCLDDMLSYQDEYHGGQDVYLGADFSMSGVKEGDFTVISVAREDKDGVLYLMDFVRFRDDPESKDMFVDKQINEVARMCKAFNVSRGYLESNAFQRIYSEYFKKKTNLPLQGNNVTQSGKNSLQGGIPGIRVLMENGKIRFPYKTELDKQKTDIILKEFNGLVMSDNGRISNQQGHDDIPMSWFHLTQACKEASKSYVIRPNKSLIKGSRAHSVLSTKSKGRRRRRRF